MKKFLVVLLIGYTGFVYAAPTTPLCSMQRIEPKQKKIDWNDYIWPSHQEHDNVKSGRQQGWAAVCGKGHGTRDYCTDGQRIEMDAGHLYRGNPVSYKETYICVTSGDDRWEVYKPETPVCSTMLQSGKPLKLTSGEEFNMDLTREMCKDALIRADGDGTAVSRSETLDSNGTTFRLFCDNNTKLQCRLTACSGSYVVSGQKCIINNNPSDDTCSAKIKGQNVTIKRGTEYGVDLTAEECKSAIPAAHGASYDNNAIYHFYCGPICKNVGCKKDYHKEGGQCVKNKVNPPKPGKTCRDQYAKDGNARLACCDVEDAGLGEWNNGKCNCYDYKDFEIVNVNHGQCIPKQQNIVPETKCPDDANPVGKTCVCTNPDMTYNAGKNSCECPSGTIKTGGVCKCADPNKELVNGKCEYGDAHWSVQIDGYYSQLHGIIDGLKLNVWRDSEGNFNTARLASDSIAGVVLGTVGGVVTAHLVKKNQLKKGFEDIQCHIGGQSVADYGDGFVVGR